MYKGLGLNYFCLFHVKVPRTLHYSVSVHLVYMNGMTNEIFVIGINLVNSFSLDMRP